MSPGRDRSRAGGRAADTGRARGSEPVGGPAWDEASLLRDRAGVRWWAAVLLALGLSAGGVFADLQRINRLGIVFQACYFAGCLLAVVLVQRKGLFGPMVQPPLLLALAVPGVVLLAGGGSGVGGLTSTALAVGTPLINGFPTMAITTGATLAVGAFRLLSQGRRRPVGGPRSAAAFDDRAPDDRALEDHDRDTDVREPGRPGRRAGRDRYGDAEDDDLGVEPRGR